MWSSKKYLVYIFFFEFLIFGSQKILMVVTLMCV
jgi:hypothetical protein